MSLGKRLSSLRYRIALTVFALESVMMVLVLWQTLSFSQQQVQQEIDASEGAIMDILAGLSRVALFSVEFDELQGYLDKAQSDPKVLSILLVNEDRMIVASTDLSEIGAEPPVFEEHEYEHWRVQAIDDLGTLAVRFSKASLIEATAAARNRGIVIAAIGMLVILSVGIVIGYWLTRRLTLLTRATEQFEQGAHAIHTDFTGDDEISELGRTFEHMRDTIERNILELETRSQELTRYSEELESFSYSLVHDLRTPVRAITSFSQILLEDAGDCLNAEQRDFLKRIIAAGNNMAQLIDDMSEVGRLARQTMHEQVINLSEMAQRSVDALRAETPLREIKTDIQPDMLSWGDRDLVHKALEQLIDNAWKFTAGCDRPVISIGSCEKDGQSVFFVRDNGCGFSMEYAGKIFEPFSRLNLEEQYAGGSGIGLVIASRIIARHGGRLWVESEAGNGAVFYFFLPGNTQ